ncbi:hypothetical protein JAAARDRAFT_169593 [Jaapia argillacea MUCL 33604]|uniref:rRNA biogenesis protein RRP36 n=1 Tax=Jaapia argillacea MUCL 33604 TaxID=933084 RepID=A0A067QJA3_9AGAM|nr:hypothetical protein JAAARDRAFT_169593 [Jaapia argillacea MUCL 33604]
MPRRPRPAHRPAPGAANVRSGVSQKSQFPKDRRDPVSDSESDSEPVYDQHAGQEDEESPNDGEEESLRLEDNLMYEEDVDAPRVAQWVDEEELDDLSEPEEEDSSENEEGDDEEGHMKSLQKDLSSLPLGALRKAQQALSNARADSESHSEDDESDEEGSITNEALSHPGSSKDPAKPEWTLKPNKDIQKRSNKHAPMEVTSKRPVTRRRMVVDVPKVEARDPRFLPVAGELDPHKFKAQYVFLEEMHQTELSTLRENLKRARKLLSSSPRDLREERAMEVARLEQAVKRAESSVNRDKRDKIEEAAIHRVKKDELEKRKQGKGAWFMKDSSKKELLVRARYDALAESGGKRAVKKAIDKKQKKISQREKKSRPFAPNRRGEDPSLPDKGSKRPAPERERDEGWAQRKRPRVA